MPQKSFNIRC